jgi:hypothetical protein
LSAERLRITTVCSAHGFGHVTRQLAIAAQLRDRGAEVSVLSAMPQFLAARLAPGIGSRRWEADVGFIQRDAFREDVTATRERLAEVCSERRIDELAAQLAGADLVVADVPATALEAARRIGVPAVAVGNFDWAWVYRHTPELADWAERFAAWQAPHPAVSLEPGPGMSGFAEVRSAGMVALQADAPAEVPHPAVLVSFGRWGFAGLARSLPRLPGVTWITDDAEALEQRDDCVWPSGVPYPALVAGADVVVTKPGYGIVAEIVLARTRAAWFPRGEFPESRYLEEVLERRGDPAVDAGDGSIEDLRAGIGSAVTQALAAPPPPPAPPSAAAEVAGLLLDTLRRRPG